MKAYFLFLCGQNNQKVDRDIQEEVRKLYHADATGKFMCTKCEKMFGSEREASAHVEGVHLGVKRFFCHRKNCSSGFYWQVDLRVHEKVTQDTSPT